MASRVPVASIPLLAKSPQSSGQARITAAIKAKALLKATLTTILDFILIPKLAFY